MADVRDSHSRTDTSARSGVMTRFCDGRGRWPRPTVFLWCENLCVVSPSSASQGQGAARPRGLPRTQPTDVGRGVSAAAIHSSSAPQPRRIWGGALEEVTVIDRDS